MPAPRGQAPPAAAAPPRQPSAVDSLAAPGIPDSSRAFAPDSLGPPVLAGAGPARVWWDAAWPRTLLPETGAALLLDRGKQPRSAALTFSDLLWRETSLGVDRAGAPGAWEILSRIGSGVERLSLWSGGTLIGGVATPEAAANAMTPLQAGRIYFSQPEPFLDPLGSGGDGLIWIEEPAREWTKSPSATRLTEGPSAAATQDLELGRQMGPWRLFAAYGHFSSEGRPFWVSPRYSATRYQDARISIDRSTGWAGWRLQASDRASRSVIEDSGKLHWQAQQLILQGLMRPSEWLTAQVGLERQNDFLRWADEDAVDRRRGGATRAVARLGLTQGPWTFLVSGGAEAVDLTLQRDPFAVEKEGAFGSGVAIGIERKGAKHAWLVDVGHAAPWWGDAHLRGHALLSASLGSALRFAMEGWSDELAPFVPRLDGDQGALLDEGILLPGGELVEEWPLRRVAHGEGRFELAVGGSRLRAGSFLRRLEHALGTDPDEAGELEPGARDSVSAATLDESLDLAGAFGDLELGLPLGLRVFGGGRVLFQPEAADLPPLTARYEGRAGLALGRRLFKGDLYLEGRALAFFRDRWTTPYGEVPAFERVDLEILGTVMKQGHFFLATRNLLNEEQPSATYVNGQWMSLPFQHTELGVEWHFFD